MSTINAAEYVIAAIAEAEGFDPREVVFFDLLTWRGYRHLGEGGHEFKRLTVDYTGDSLQVTEWTATPSPPEILQLFEVFIN